MGGHLVQVPKGQPRSEGRLLACTSRTLSPAERNYCISERECLAIVFACDKFRNYIYEKEVTIETDHHALCFLKNLKNPTGRLARWAILMQRFKCVIKYNAGRKHVDADCLSRYPLAASLKDLDKEYFTHDIIQPNVLAYTAADEPIDQPGPSSRSGPIADTKIVKDQLKDPELTRIIRLIKEQNNAKEKSRYAIVDQALYKRTTFNGQTRFVLCVPKNRVKEVLIAGHDSTLAGHVGRDKSYDNIRAKYYWKNMYKDMCEYVDTCPGCQKFKYSNQPRTGLSQPLPIPERPFAEIALDLVGPLRTTKRGNKYLLSIADRLTKFSAACALPDIEGPTVMRALQEEWLLRYGICETLLTDRGPNICSALSEEFYKSYGIKHLTTSAYNPECNGQIENLNKFLATSLAVCVHTRDVQWDDALSATVFAYNCSFNRVTKNSPYFLAFGMTPRTNIDNDLGFLELSDEPMDRSEQILRLMQSRKQARDNIAKVQKTNQNYVNKKRRDIEFQVGDRVLLELKQVKTTKGGKLLPKYAGPYVIQKKLGPLTYRLVKKKGPFKSSIVHAKRLKLYKQRQSSSETSSESSYCSSICLSSDEDTIEESDLTDTDTELYWEDEPEFALPMQSKRVRNRPKYLREYQCYRYGPLSQ